MRILTVCLALLLIAATAEAQGRGGGGFHGGGGGFRGGGGGFRGGGGGFRGGGGGFHSGGGGFQGFGRGGLHAGAPTFRENPGFRRGFGSGFDRGFRRGFRGFDNRSVVISPFFGFPFFSAGIDPFYSGPIFTAPPFITPDQTIQSIGNQTGEDLRSQIGQLTTEVQQLQAELAAARGQSTPTSAAAQNAPAVILILKDGRRIEAAGYALVGSTLWILNAEDATKISLSDVDVDATQKENQNRGINVVIPPNASQRRLR
jgi:hypothetical protein